MVRLEDALKRTKLYCALYERKISNYTNRNHWAKWHNNNAHKSKISQTSDIKTMDRNLKVRAKKPFKMMNEGVNEDIVLLNKNHC